MKAKIFLSSILTIALCLSLIVGSTFALFETEKTVNIAVTAGKVDVEASITPSKVDASNMLCYDAQNPYANASSDGKVLTISKMVPGDSVSFEIQVTNNSNVPIKYMVTSSVSDTNKELMKVLSCTATVKGETVTVDSSTATDESAYFEAPAASGNGSALTTVTVTLTFLTNVTGIDYDDFQEKGAEISFLVKAVQGNG